jgi:hypothetical protein
LVASVFVHVMVGTLQLSVAATLLGLKSQSGITVGLQPRLVLAGHNVNTGRVVSIVQVATCTQVATLLQASTAR